MNILENILKEIEDLHGELGSECTSEDYYMKRAWEYCLNCVKEIIIRHMNDGWIPVKEHLPEEAGTYIINALDGQRNVVTFAKWQNKYKRFDMTGARSYWRITAWHPLPEPYRPERSWGE